MVPSSNKPLPEFYVTWWRHQTETVSALLALCVQNSPVIGKFPTQRPVTRTFNFFYDLRLNKRLSKQSWGWRFETLSRSLWRHSNEHMAWLCHNELSNSNFNSCFWVCALLVLSVIFIHEHHQWNIHYRERDSNVYGIIFLHSYTPLGSWCLWFSFSS